MQPTIFEDGQELRIARPFPRFVSNCGDAKLVPGGGGRKFATLGRGKLCQMKYILVVLTNTNFDGIAFNEEVKHIYT
jgi:hypothetical protein